MTKGRKIRPRFNDLRYFPHSAGTSGARPGDIRTERDACRIGSGAASTAKPAMEAAMIIPRGPQTGLAAMPQPSICGLRGREA